MTVGLIWQAFLLLASGVVAVMAMTLLRKYPAVVPVIAAVYVLIAWEVPNVPALTTVAGTSVYLLDVLSIALLAISTKPLLRIGRTAPLLVTLWLLLFGILAFSLLRGVLGYGLNTAANEFRGFLPALATLQWAFTLSWDSRLTAVVLDRGSRRLGWALTGLLALHALIYGLGGAGDSLETTTGVSQTGRPLVAGQALVLLLCAILAFAQWIQRRHTFALMSAAVFLSGVILVQHRSVWAATLGAVSLALLAAPWKVRVRLVATGALMALAGAIVIVAGGARGLGEQLAASSQDMGTYVARQVSWQGLLGQFMSSGDLLSILFGAPMGAGYGRFEGAGRWVEFAPHNWYITVLLRAGIVGLSLLVILLIRALWAILRKRQVPGAAIVGALLVFGWAYSWPWYAMIPLGWALSFAAKEMPIAADPWLVPSSSSPARIQAERVHTV